MGRDKYSKEFLDKFRWTRGVELLTRKRLRVDENSLDDMIREELNKMKTWDPFKREDPNDCPVLSVYLPEVFDAPEGDYAGCISVVREDRWGVDLTVGEGELVLECDFWKEWFEGDHTEFVGSAEELEKHCITSASKLGNSQEILYMYRNIIECIATDRGSLISKVERIRNLMWEVDRSFIKFEHKACNSRIV